MDAVDGGRSRRLPVLVRFGVGEGAVSAEISGWARTSPRYDSDRPRGHHRMLIRRRGEVVSDIQQDRRRRHHRITAKSAGRKVFGLATAGVRLA